MASKALRNSSYLRHGITGKISDYNIGMNNAVGFQSKVLQCLTTNFFVKIMDRGPQNILGLQVLFCKKALVSSIDPFAVHLSPVPTEQSLL